MKTHTGLGRPRLGSDRVLQAMRLMVNGVLDEEPQQHPRPLGTGERVARQPPGRRPAPSTTADDAGGFSLTVDLPAYAAQWPCISLRVDREGHEAADASLGSADATREVLITTYRSLTISPGESIQTTVSLPRWSCGYWSCRRVLVNSPSGELVDLEVFPADGQKEVGLSPVRDQLEFGVDWPRRLTVAGGDEVWIVVGEPRLVTLRATGR